MYFCHFAKLCFESDLHEDADSVFFLCFSFHFRLEYCTTNHSSCNFCCCCCHNNNIRYSSYYLSDLVRTLLVGERLVMHVGPVLAD